MPSLARSVPKPLKVPCLARSVPKPLSIELREAGGQQPGRYDLRASFNSNEGGIPTNPNILNARVEGLVCDKCCKWFSQGNFPNMEKLVLAVDEDVREFMGTHSKLRMIEFECYQNK